MAIQIAWRSLRRRSLRILKHKKTLHVGTTEQAMLHAILNSALAGAECAFEFRLNLIKPPNRIW